MNEPIHAELKEIVQSLQAIEETLRLVREHQIKTDLRLDRFQHKVISLEASLDEKLGLWKEEQQIG